MPGTAKDYRHFCVACEVGGREETCWVCGQQMELGQGNNVCTPRADKSLTAAMTHFQPAEPEEFKQLPYVEYDWKKWEADRTVQGETDDTTAANSR